MILFLYKEYKSNVMANNNTKQIEIKLYDNEGNITLSNSTLNQLLDTFNVLLTNFQLNNIFQDVIPNNDNFNNQLFTNCIGHVLEEYIKIHITNVTSPEIKNHFRFKKDKWYDFKFDNTNIKILVFKKNASYSTNPLSISQYENKKDMLFVSIIYDTNENNVLNIDEILVTEGKYIKIGDNDKVLYSSIVPYVIEPDDSEETVEYLNALRLVFTSNIAGNVQILDI